MALTSLERRMRSSKCLTVCCRRSRSLMLCRMSRVIQITLFGIAISPTLYELARPLPERLLLLLKELERHGDGKAGGDVDERGE